MEDSNKRTPRTWGELAKARREHAKTWGEVTEKLRERRKVIEEQNEQLRKFIDKPREDDNAF
jgi:septal ring factor EnvC (AmiA/AmiB activator)